MLHKTSLVGVPCVRMNDPYVQSVQGLHATVLFAVEKLGAEHVPHI